MAEEAQYSSDGGSNKRKYDDQAAPRRPTGFSAPIASASPDSAPPSDDIQIAKQRAQEIAARLFNSATATAAGGGGGGGSPLDSTVKRPRVDNGGYDSGEYKGFSSAPPDAKPISSYSAPSAMPMSYGGFSGASKKIEIPNGRVGVIIGKGGDTIKYLQVQSGAKIQITRDADADPHSANREVELTGNSDQIAKAESLIKDVLQQAETGGSSLVARRVTGQGASGEPFTMRIPNNKVGLVIGKGGETIKTMQANTGARIQVIPLHLPPGDTSTERTVQIEGSTEQIEHAKQLIAEVTQNRQQGGGYQQQGYQARPASWASTGAQMPQSGYGYVQPGAYPGQTPQYNMTQPPYGGYPQQASWDPSNTQSTQQTAPGAGYDYYNQQQSAQQQQAPGGPDNTGYNYSQAPASGYGQQGQGYAQDGYGGYSAAQSGYGQQASYDQQGYGSAPSYGNAASATQEGQTASYGAPGDAAAQAPPTSAGYSTGQLTSPGAPSYPQGAPAVTTQPGYGAPPASQAGYVPVGGYGAPQGQKPQAYGQAQQSPTNPGAYAQPAYQGYSQPDPASQRAPSSGYGAAPPQAGYGAQSYGAAAPGTQQAYGQAAAAYNSYGGGGGYSQAPPAYSGEGEAAPATSQPSGVAKSSPPS